MVLVMTTNAGVRETERKSIGLIHQDNSTDAMEEIKKIFTPDSVTVSTTLSGSIICQPT